ncbi:uncharacterized protein JCM6883_001937 [Sporobolomyces salmoneus]|uniref:uncharacterized protein n=1 Tax=Sporobolomyces salmoneus TaxID=183962 RepID=UPI0031745817
MKAEPDRPRKGDKSRSDTASSQIAYSQGLQAYRAASYETAVELFTQAIQIDPKNPKLYDARASAYDKLGKLQEALIDAREVIKLLPTSHKGYLRAGRLLKQGKKYANAEKLVSHGLEKVPKKDEKGISELEGELASIQALRSRAEFCPFSNLPLEIFVEIISIATAPPPSSRYTINEIPRSRPPRSNPLVNLMRVSRNWCRVIKGSPQLWQTLRLDGIINAKNAVKKTRIYLQRALGQGEDSSSNGRNIGRSIVKHKVLEGDTTARGIQRIIFTAAQDIPSPAFTSILEQLQEAGVTSTLREVVLSFVDGSLTTISNEREASIATELLVFLHSHSQTCLVSLSICTGGRCYPAFDLTSIYLAFPRLESFNIWGSTTSNFVSNLRAPFLHNANSISEDTEDDASHSDVEEPPLPPPTNARNLTVTGSVLVADISCRLSSFPRLESLELDLIGGSIVWDLLSTPNLSKFYAVIYGESHTLSLPVPDLASSWAKLQHLKLGGAKYLPGRFLNHAISLDLSFHHLTSLDLSFSSLSTRHLALFDSRTQAPHLETLNLASTTTGPTESALVLPQLDSLKSLDVSHTLWTNDETIRDLVKKCSKLEKLAVVGNAFITGRPVMELVLARKPPRVEGDEGGTRFSEMTELKLEGCDKLETAAVEWLKKNTKPGVVKFQFIDPADRRKGRWDRGFLS